MDITACLDDTLSPPLLRPHFLAVAVGEMRGVINRVVSMFDGE